MRVNKLSPNPSKTEYMIIGHPRKAKGTNAPIGLTLSNKEIKRASTTKSLGVRVGEYLNWDDQFKTVNGAVKWNFFIASKRSAKLQNHDRFDLFSIFEHFPAKNASFIATGSRKTSAMKQQQLIPVWRKVSHCSLKLLAKNTIFSGFHSRRS